MYQQLQQQQHQFYSPHQCVIRRSDQTQTTVSHFVNLIKDILHSTFVFL